MKILGRVLIILAVFTLVMGITYVVVNAGSSANSTNVPGFPRPDGDRPSFSNGERPEFPGGERNELRAERGAGWMFGVIKNIVVISIIVALIVVPRGWMQKRKRSEQLASE